MFTEPPYLISYTAPGFPLQWEAPRSSTSQYFNFLGGAQVGHWPEFSNLDEAYSALWYVRQMSPHVNVELYDILGNAELPPGVGYYPVPIQAHNKPDGDTTSIWAIIGTVPIPNDTARILYYAGTLFDAQQGLYSPLEGRYLGEIGANFDDQGNQVTGPKAWPWDAMYAYVSPETPGEAQLYWGVQSTGPALGGLPVG